ncbi:MAG: hypothetical protein KBC56_07890 [Flavobacterium sp.]|nr:hypothetical protein [Flavobacterium sp.]
MVRVFTTAVLLFCSAVFGQAKFEEGMGKALGTWKSGQATEASALFERIASVEKTNWLPNYYVAMINTVEAFKPENREKATSLIEKGQNALNNAKLISPNNAEINVMQALIYTAILVQDPMTNGMKYSPLAMTEYQKALAIDPKNPRAVFGKAEFELGSAKWTGADTKPICAQVANSIELFATFKPETPFHPNWGLDRAQEVLTSCK